MSRVPLSYFIRTNGLLNFPGASAASRKCAEDLVHKDSQSHHCYFRPAGLHNHLSHHILAAYDLGAPPALLKKIYEEEASIQRPIFLEEKDKTYVIHEDKWTEHLGNPSAYGAYFKYFSKCVEESGPVQAIERHVFSKEAYKEDVQMLARVLGGALHPFIVIGYGLEFENDELVAAGLAQAAVHVNEFGDIFQFGHSNTASADQTSKGKTLLEIFKEIYASDILHPTMPYQPQALFMARFRDVISSPERVAEIRRISAQFVPASFTSSSASGIDKELEKKADEIIWASVLLMFAAGKEGRKPRLDFFLMHAVTSSLFFFPWLSALRNPEHKADLFRAYIPVLVTLVLSRGRPRINADLAMAFTDSPRPPLDVKGRETNAKASGNPKEDADYNPWPALIEDVLYFPDTHVVKSMRTLLFAAQKYGTTPAGGAIGAFVGEGTDKETLPGLGKLDGTVFVRAAGVMMNYMGWVSYGQTPREDWDRSAYGWEAAWEGED